MVRLLLCVLALLATQVTGDNSYGCYLASKIPDYDLTLPQYGNEKPDGTTPSLGLNPANRRFGDPGLCCALHATKKSDLVKLKGQTNCHAVLPQVDRLFYQQTDNPQAGDLQQELLNGMHTIIGEVRADHEMVDKMIGRFKPSGVKPNEFFLKNSFLRTATQIDVELCNDKTQSYYEAQTMAYEICQRWSGPQGGFENREFKSLPESARQCDQDGLLRHEGILSGTTLPCVFFEKENNEKNSCKNYKIKFTDRHGNIISRKLKGNKWPGGMYDGLLVPDSKSFDEDVCNTDKGHHVQCGKKPEAPQLLQCRGDAVEEEEGEKLYATLTEWVTNHMRQKGMGNAKSVNLNECVMNNMDPAACLGDVEITEARFSGVGANQGQLDHFNEVVVDGRLALEEELRSLEKDVVALTETA